MTKFIIILAVVALVSFVIISVMNNKPISIVKPKIERSGSKNKPSPQISIPTRPFIEDDSRDDVHTDTFTNSSENQHDDEAVDEAVDESADEAILVDIDAL